MNLAEDSNKISNKMVSKVLHNITKLLQRLIATHMYI